MKQPPQRPRDADATREALLAAATALFARQGFDGVTVEAIATAARVNKAMVSYYFRGKAGLYEAILTSTFGEIAERVDALRRSKHPPADLLREFMTVFQEMATVRRPSFPALFLREALEGGPRARKVVVPYLLTILGAVREVVERGVREGSFRPVDPVLTHLSIVGSLVFFFATAPLRAQVFADGKMPFPLPDAGAYVRHMQELVARGLASDRGRRARRKQKAPPRRRR